ncbi:DUF445 domain-containing protein [Halalkalibacillus halophilus]|uniref:DUF445 domain-containing protein n=1 Tax=Halalkalibacillus halophilus TaxID=392827 RepID=UPI0003F9C121|nr:DUF445 family protein [Halalkalibacillus halophilus]
MDTLFLILLMVAIGALIGGMTNYLAIKMLFRPYHPVYIGKWKLPFTPGLIPKRRQELAVQLGGLVTNHLVTADAIGEKLSQSKFHQQISSFINHKLINWLEQNHTVQEAVQQVKKDFSKEQTQKETQKVIEKELRAWYEEHSKQNLAQILPHELQEYVDQSIPGASQVVLQKVDQYVSSVEAKIQFSQAASEFLENQGFLGNMVNSYLGADGLVEKIEPSIKQFVTAESTEEKVTAMMRDEWNKWLEEDLDSLKVKYGSDAFFTKLSAEITSFIQIDKQLDRPVNELVAAHKDYLTTKLVPELVNRVFTQLAGQVDVLMEQMQVASMVQAEVEKFDVSRIEQMVLEITKKEFNMITYLGAVLGGSIGLLQAIVVLFMI